jgi:hypothetical protein
MMHLANYPPPGDPDVSVTAEGVRHTETVLNASPFLLSVEFVDIDVVERLRQTPTYISR